ncbi:MAG: hypothetical protein LQ344_005633 [Seirophora lacunosa]|nr:MAG: hypothetical protein LQ344_005633 [Seirophora lacunosa]
MFPTKISAVLQTALILLLIFAIHVETTPLNNASPTPQNDEPDPSSTSLLAKRAPQSASPSLSQSSVLFNTTTLIYHTFNQLSLAAAPFLAALFTYIDAFAKESLLGAKPIADTFECGYGLLELVIFSPDGVNIPWDVVGRIARHLYQGIVRGMMGFFRACWEVTAGVCVGVVFGVPPFKDWREKDDGAGS